MIRSLGLAVGLLFAAASANAQAVIQSGPWQLGHAPMYVGTGAGGVPPVMDSGNASGYSVTGTTGTGFSETLQKNRSPLPASGSGPLGAHNCAYSTPDAPLSATFSWFCVDANIGGNPAIVVGGNPPVSGLSVWINGTETRFVTGVTPSVIGNIACWANTTGSLLNGCPGGATLGSPTGGLLGAGDFNVAGNYYVNGVAVPSPTLAAACLNAQAYGADPTGVADSKPALVAAVAALPTSGGCVQFPPGTFKFNSTYSFAYPTAQAQSAYSLGIYGSGITATRLLWPATDGIVATTNEFYQSFHLRDLSMETGTPGTYTAVTLTTTINEGNGLSDFTHVAFGTTTAGTSSVYCGGGGACNYWGTAVNDAQSNIQFTQDYFYGDLGAEHGVGLHFQGIAGGPFKYSLNHHISDSYFWGLQYGIVYDSYTQGVSIEKSQFGFGCYQGIYSPASADPGPAGLELLVVSNSDIECDNAAIVLQGPVFEVQLSNNQMDNAAGASAITFGNASSDNTIVGNWITSGSSTGSNGIYAGGASPAALTDSTIAANVFKGEGVGIVLNSSASNVTITGNTYNGVTTDVIATAGTYARSAERSTAGQIVLGTFSVNTSTGNVDTGPSGGGYYIDNIPIAQYSGGNALLGVSTVGSGLDVSVDSGGNLGVPATATVGGLNVETTGVNVYLGNLDVVAGAYYIHNAAGITASATASNAGCTLGIVGGIITSATNC